jgi:hypothetical protein
MAQNYVLSALATNFRPHLDYYKPAKALHHLFLSKILFNYESSCYKSKSQHQPPSLFSHILLHDSIIMLIFAEKYDRYDEMVISTHCLRCNTSDGPDALAAGCG